MGVEKEKSERIREEIKRSKSKDAVVDVDEKRIKVVMFSLGGDHYAFEGDYVKEILLPSEITYVPGSAAHILGVINVRGDIESVVAIDRLLGLSPPEPSAGNRFLIAEHGEIRSGVLVEKVEDVVDIPESTIKPPLSTMGSAVADYIQGEIDYAGRTVILLDLKKIFAGFLSHED